MSSGIGFWSKWRERTRLAIVIACLTGLIVASLGLGLYAELRHEDQARLSAEIQARILADSVAAALASNDAEAIQRYIPALRANPDTLTVAVYNENGALIASYGVKRVQGTLTDMLKAPKVATLAVTEPVMHNGKPMGSVYFAQRTEPLSTRIARYAPAGLLVIMALLMLTVMAFDARALNRGNKRLRQEMEERERAEAALRQSQKMEAVGRLTGGIAHDFNNMLAVVLGNLDLLLRRFPDADPKLLRSAAMAQDGARRAAALTQRLLAFSRRQPLDPKSADIGKSVEDMSDLLCRTLGEGIEIETVRAENLWYAHVDIGQLEMALVNLAVNARDAMPDGGRLSITTANAHLDGAPLPGAHDAHEDIMPGAYVMVSVTDTGTGMTPEVLAQVFEPFFTTKPVGKGTGLGLSQVHGFVRQSGGHINIESRPGQGTSIRLYLPRSEEEATSETASVTERRAVARFERTVLVVDDEPGVRDYATEALAELGYKVLSASSADQALQVLSANPRIEVLLTDVVMPGKSGWVLGEAAQKARPNLRILYMTGYTQDVTSHRSMPQTGVRLLAKPFTTDHLGAEMEALLAEAAEGVA